MVFAIPILLYSESLSIAMDLQLRNKRASPIQQPYERYEVEALFLAIRRRQYVLFF